MQFELAPERILRVSIDEHSDYAGVFDVRALDDDGGEHVARFVGQLAEAQARAFAQIAYGYTGEPAFTAPRRARPVLTLI